MFAKKNSTSLNIKEIISYTYPKLYTGKDWYIGFQAFDPISGNLKRKRIRINYIGKPAEKKKYAAALIFRISRQLDQGWNPWIEAENEKAYHTFNDVCKKYQSYLTKLNKDGSLRDKTMRGYLSMLRLFMKWNEQRKTPITYIYQYEKSLISDYLEYVYIEKDSSIRTRNNYLSWLVSFDMYLVQNSYITKRATEGISKIRKTSKKKDRDVIAKEDMTKLREFLHKENKHFLLACYILHYTLIRPKEMSYLKLEHFNLKKQTIFVSGEFSKNKKDAIVTLPAKVIELMIELNVFKNPSNYYLFSEKFMPGVKRKGEMHFTHYWADHVRKKLNFSDRYKFYSLKDTGITNMLRSCDTLTVRDQARHSSILMTNIYTPQDVMEANSLLKNYEGDF